MISFSQENRVTYGDLARSNDRTVQGHPSTKLAVDSLKHANVLFQAIRIEGGHHASFPQIDRLNDSLADLQFPALPQALRQAVHAADDEVRPQPSAILAERLN